MSPDQTPELGEQESANSVGARIARYRADKNMSATRLAFEAEISKSYLSSIEAEGAPHRRPSADVLYRIAKALGVTMADLLGRSIAPEVPAELPEGLQEFAAEENLLRGDVEMLASIHFRGERPRTPERWRFIYQAIRISEGLDKRQ
jgi:transcriptional regulator with XRE-family HTH domain